MKILHIIDHLGLGGAQIVVKGIFEAQKNNKDIFLYALRKREIETKINHPNVIILNSTKKYSLTPLKELKRLIKKEKIEVLHCHLFKSQVIGYLLKKRYFPNIKLIFHEHGQIFGSETSNSIENYVFKKFMKIAQKQTNLFIAVSKATKRKLIEKANIDPKKIVVLYNFVDTKKFNRKNIKWKIQKERERLEIKKDEFVIGFAGRLIERKGWKEFIEAANILVKDNKKFKFLIAGDGSQKQEMLNLINKYKLDKNVTYLSYQSKMVLFYSLLDVFVIPSHWEPMGLTEIEAQSMHVPIIASNVPALNEIIINKENGLLFEGKDSTDLVRKIETIYSNKNLRKKLIKNGLESAKNYSLEKYLKNLNKIHEK